MVFKIKKNLHKKKRSQPPLGFGARYPRFANPTHHPLLDPSGLYVERDRGCDPCLYEPVSMSKVYEVNKNVVKRDIWKFKADLEAWSKNLGYRNMAILEERSFRATLGGPAFYVVKEQIKQDFSKCKNVGFGTALRFKPVQYSYPAPGTYNYTISVKTDARRSTVQLFAAGPPCRFKESPCALAPNRYTPLDKDSIEMKSKKVVSLRGPYDLFTGPRDDTTIKNRLATTKLPNPSWPWVFPGCMERLKKSHLGVMNKTGRDGKYGGRNVLVNLDGTNKSPSDPGPADLNLAPIVTQFKKNKASFLSSDYHPPGYKRFIVWPGVGTYDLLRHKPHIAGNGHKSVFLCKVKRTNGYYLQPPLNSF